MPRSPIRRPRLAEAFTLIELMIVVAIIGILAGLMTGVVGYVQNSAKRNQCLNNLRQWGGAMSLYLDEHRSRTFPTYMKAEGAGEADLWWNALPPYLEKGSKPPFTCPCDETVGEAAEDGDVFDNKDYRSYSINPWVHDGRNKAPRTKRLRDSQLKFPSAFVVMFEGPQSVTNNLETADDVGDSLAGYADFRRHGRSTNALFADGHAESLVREAAVFKTQMNPNRDLQGNPL